MSDNAQEFQSFNPEDIEAVRDAICPPTKNGKCPDHIIRLILYRCKQLGADPMAKMIYAIERQGKWTLQCSIDLFRATAESSDGYAGQDGPYWCGQDGQWVDVWLQKTPPAAAKVGVLRSTFAQPMYAVANWDSYAQSPNESWSLWKKMGPLMLAKCAEALAIRRAFPARLSGIYTSDEMMQADTAQLNATPAPTTAPAALPPAQERPTVGSVSSSAAQVEIVRSLGKRLGKLAGAFNADLARLGGDIGALEQEYERQLATKTPRGSVAPVAETPSAGTAATEAPSRSTAPVDPITAEDPGREDTSTPEKGESPAPISEKDQVWAAIELQKELLEPVNQAKLVSLQDRLDFINLTLGREDVTQFSQLNANECSVVIEKLKALSPAQPLVQNSEASSDARKTALTKLQIECKDASFIARLERSKAFEKAAIDGASRTESLKAARLAFGAKILGREVQSFNECTDEEILTLTEAAKKFKAGK